MGGRGWALFPGQLTERDLVAIGEDLERIYRACRAVQLRNGVGGDMEGTAHHVLGYGGAIDRFVNHLPLYETIERHFGGKVIILNAGAVLNPPNAAAYTSRPHRDIRAFSPRYPLSLNMLVMLDDFTVENGATRLLPGSHLMPEMASDTAFARDAVSVTGKAGDIVLFDSLVVHAAGPNRSESSRRALTLCFGRPFMKPQMDWPRFLSAEAEAGLTGRGRQLLGYDARVATSLDEYYQPPERWTFKADQR
jgi:ectoine hydroxylase-related dioxygenase (phytanoyl-CoA dioxygenase family)